MYRQLSNHQNRKTYRVVVILCFGLILFLVSGQLFGQSDYGETFYVKENTRTRKPIRYVHEREADIMWSKRVWRTIDLREKFNHPLYFPETPTNARLSLFDVIEKGLIEGSIYAYDNPVFDDEFKVRMTTAQVAQLFTWYDSTNLVADPYNPDNMIQAPIQYNLTANMIKQYWVKEDWFWDRQRSVMDVRIIGICPLQEKTDAAGEVIGYKPLFWLYFPACRDLFARHEVFNTKNDAQRLSFDDVFHKRMFGSYVRKESNVYDRTIESYAPGLDALLEADRVKEDIFKTEHDMWHF